MKQLLTLLIVLASSSIFAQTLYTRTDTIPITQDSLTLKPKQFRGKLQWQHSLDGKTWNNIAGKTSATLKVAATGEGYYRVQITDGTCLPFYSDTAVIYIQKTKNELIVDPDKIGTATLVDRDNDTYKYVVPPNTTEIIPLNTVLVDSDKQSDIRVVTMVTQKDDTLTVKTSQGNMENLFYNQEFKLTTEMVSTQLKGAHITNGQLSKAMTDKDGFIHPVEVIDMNASPLKTKNAIVGEDIPVVNFSSSFNGEKLYNKNGLELTITEGSYYMGCVFKCEFKFEQKKFLWGEIPTGKLQGFMFYTDKEKTGADAKLIVQAKASGNVSLNEIFVLKEGVYRNLFKFWVGEVPVWMYVKIDLMARATGKLGGTLSVTGGISSNLKINLGAKYEAGAWTPFFDPIKNFNLHGPDYDGHINYDLRIEVYPRTEILFYNAIGPYFEIVPYLYEKMDCSIAGNYNLGLYAGLDSRIGTTGNIFGWGIPNFSKEYNILKDALYQIPEKMEIVSGNNQEGTAGRKLEQPIILKLVDLHKEPIIDMPVYFDPKNGTVDKTTLKTDNQGKVSVYWTLESSSGDQILEAYLKDGNDKKLENTVISIKAKGKVDMPSVLTYAISNISEKSALGGGNVTDDGGSEVTARGVCWNTSGNPTISDSKTTDVSGTGSFSSSLYGLTEGTTYYVRAYATNSKGTTYGNQVGFTTKSSSYTTIATASVSNITANSATCGGTISSNETITTRGVCWNTTGNPTITDSKTESGVGTGAFTTGLSGLTANMTYYVRAYATTDKGTEYGNQLSFTTTNNEPATGTFTDSRDGKSYKWVKIGTQTWMAENLSYLPYITPIGTYSQDYPSYYISDLATYGVYYNWSASRNACPSGWHLPNDSEWTTLYYYLGGAVAGGKMKTTIGWNSPNTGATNSSCFSGLPAGKVSYGNVYDIGNWAMFWSSTQKAGIEGKGWMLYATSSILSMFTYDYERDGPGYSIRCIKD